MHGCPKQDSVEIDNIRGSSKSQQTSKINQSNMNMLPIVLSKETNAH